MGKEKALKDIHNVQNIVNVARQPLGVVRVWEREWNRRFVLRKMSAKFATDGKCMQVVCLILCRQWSNK